jgi:hypothetical protein
MVVGTMGSSSELSDGLRFQLSLLNLMTGPHAPAPDPSASTLTELVGLSKSQPYGES